MGELSVGNNFENLYSKFQLNNPSNTDSTPISNQITNSNSNNNFTNQLSLLSSNQFNDHQQQLLNHHNMENNNYLNHYQKPLTHQQQYQFEPHSSNLPIKKTNKSSKNSLFESNENENNTKFISNMLQQKTQISNFHQIETSMNLQADSNVNSNTLSNYTNHQLHYNQSHQQLLMENQNIKHTNTKHCDNTGQVNIKLNSYPKQPTMLELAEQQMIYGSNNKQPSSILSSNNNSEKQISTEEQLDTIAKDSNTKTISLTNESSNLEQMNHGVSKAIRSSNSACSSTSSSCFSFTSPCSSASASASNSCVHSSYQIKNPLDKSNDSQSKQFSKQLQSNDHALQIPNDDSSNDHKKQQENFVQIVKNCLNSTREIEQPTNFNNSDSSMLTKQIFDAINTAVLLNQVSTPSTTSSFVSHKTSSLLSTPILTTPNPISNNQPSVSNSFNNSLSPSILSVNQNNNESFNRNNLNNITSSNKETRHLASNMFSSDLNSSSINKNNINKQKNKPLPLIIPSDISAFQQQKNQQNIQNHFDHSTQHNSHHPNQVPYYHQLSANSSNNAYMSHIYPHATLLKSPRLLTNDFKKQYTPPPMLSPFRKGPGLYYKYFANMFLMPNAFNQPKPPQLNHSMSCSYAYSPSLFYNQFLNLHNNNNNSNNSNLSENESKSNLLIKNNNEAMISNKSPSVSYSADKNEVKKEEISNLKENKEKNVPGLSSLDNSSKNNIIDAISSTNKVNNQQTVNSFTPKQSLIRSRLRN
jgi:hypothetical protein